jgi:ribosomal protein L37AE/L43A
MVDPLADCESCGRRLPAHRMHRIGSGHLLCEACYAQMAGVTGPGNPPAGSAGPSVASGGRTETH